MDTKQKRIQDTIAELLEEADAKKESKTTREAMKALGLAVLKKLNDLSATVRANKVSFPTTTNVKVLNPKDFPKTVVNIPSDVTLRQSSWLTEALNRIVNEVKTLSQKEEKEKPTYVQIVDETNPGVTYVGEANPGSKHSEAVWCIQKASTTNGVSYIEYANGNNKYDKKWSERKELDYS